MARIKYYYNTETCRYEPVKTTVIQRLLGGFTFIGLSVIFGLTMVLLYAYVFESPALQLLKKENEELHFHYKLLNQELEEQISVIEALQDRDNNIYRAVFEAHPVKNDVKSLAKTKLLADLKKSNLEQEDLLFKMHSKLLMLQKQMYVQSKSYDQLTALAKNKANMVKSIPAIQPVSNKKLQAPISGFGFRIHPIYKVKKMHTGLDFCAPKGTNVYATGDGVVITASSSFSGYGNEIEINHGYGYVTKYAHLSAFKIKRGQKVKRGQLIGLVGSTGTSVAPHLHYEVTKNGTKVNPVHYFFQDLKPQEYQKLLEKASEENQSMGGE